MKNIIKTRTAPAFLLAVGKAAIALAIVLNTLTLTGCGNPAGDTDNLPAAAPVITKQPQDRLYFIGETVEPLEVAGKSPDGGTISYQWYSNTTAASSGGTAISGAVNAAYTPEVSNSTVNNYYYYAVLTNGTKTASTASKSARISVVLSADGNQSVNVYMSIPDPNQPANRFQYIRGYGGMDVTWRSSVPLITRADTELMYNPDKLGYNILRIMILPDHVDPAQSIAELIAAYQPDYYENVKIVNKYGGYVLASPWTPPADWKSNNSTGGGWPDNRGYLLPQYYPQYAQYLRDFAQNMYDHGAPIYCISIQSEPNYHASYDGCLWEPEQMRDFFIQQGHFTDGVRGYGGGKEIPAVLTMNGESAYTPYINNAALQNSTSKAAIDVLGRHSYNERTQSLWNDYPDLLQKGGINDTNKGRMEVWMTEHNINSGNIGDYHSDSTWNFVWLFLNDVDLAIRLNNENAFVWWAGKHFYSLIGSGEYGATTEGVPLPRGWALSHYARFTIGMTRIKIDTDTTRSVMKDRTPITHVGQSDSILNNIIQDNIFNNNAVRVTAFTSVDGREISLIMWAPTNTNGSGGYDPGTIEVALPSGFTANGVTAVRSNGGRADQLFQPYDVQISGDRTKGYITLGKGEIVSVKFSK